MRFPAFHNRAPGHFPKEKFCCRRRKLRFLRFPLDLHDNFISDMQFRSRCFFQKIPFFYTGQIKKTALLLRKRDKCPADPGRSFSTRPT